MKKLKLLYRLWKAKSFIAVVGNQVVSTENISSFVLTTFVGKDLTSVIEVSDEELKRTIRSLLNVAKDELQKQ